MSPVEALPVGIAQPLSTLSFIWRNLLAIASDRLLQRSIKSLERRRFRMQAVANGFSDRTLWLYNRCANTPMAMVG